jgi:hypothetical protein
MNSREKAEIKFLLAVVVRRMSFFARGKVWGLAGAETLFSSGSHRPVEKTASVSGPLTLRFEGQQCSWKTVKTELDFGQSSSTTGRSIDRASYVPNISRMRAACSGQSRFRRLG